MSQTARGRNFTAGELFCGAGGLSRGFHDLGFEPLFANDAWDMALHTFLMNFDAAYRKSEGRKAGEIVKLSGSVEQIDPRQVIKDIDVKLGGFRAGDLDILLGGPPCQGFSVNSHIRSAEDPRNFLFRHYIRVLRGLAPKVFVLENVPGMLSLDGGRFFDELVNTLSSPDNSNGAAYDIDFKILNAAHYGVPQERFRVVVVGTRRDISQVAGCVTLPAPVHYSLAKAHFKGGRAHTFHYAIGHGKRRGQTVTPLVEPHLLPPRGVYDAIGDLPPLQNGGGFDAATYPRSISMLSAYQAELRGSCKTLTNHWSRALLPPNTERVKHIPAGGDWRSIPQDLLPPGMQKALRKDHTKRYGRLSPDDPSGTLLTKPDPHWGTFLHYDLGQQRLISVREAARLQSFPDCHVFYGGQVDQYKLCGNAVPPLMAKAIASRVESVLNNFYGRSPQFADAHTEQSAYAL